MPHRCEFQLEGRSVGDSLRESFRRVTFRQNLCSPVNDQLKQSKRIKSPAFARVMVILVIVSIEGSAKLPQGK